jgi:UDP-glucose 4-epimerase
MAKILVTGGAGFIGSVTVEQLLKEGFEVVCFDLPEQLARSSPPKEAKVHQGNILSPDDVTSAIKGCEHVIHLAAMLGVNRTEMERAKCLDINIVGTRNVLEACVKEDVKKIILSSSSEVYGQQAKIPISEENPLSPKSVYAISKLACEQYLMGYKKRYGLDFCILRFFNVYGERQVAEFVMPRFIRRVLNNQPPVIYGDGKQIRAFCYVEDAARGIISALTNEKADSEIFNIGNDKEPISMRDLAYKIIALSGKHMEPEFIPIANYDRAKAREIWQRVPNIWKATKLLGYEPRISLAEGITRIMEHGNFEESWPDSGGHGR